MATEKPEGYPYTTVVSVFNGHTPVLVDWHSNGYEQITVVKNTEDDFVAAKRVAVILAKDHGCQYKVPVHG